MSTLIFLNDLKDPQSHRILWYFADAERWNHHATSNFVWRVDHTKRYPHAVYVHVDYTSLYSSRHRQGIQADMHDWIRLHCEHDVVYDYVNMDYKFEKPRDQVRDWYSSTWTEVRHGYHGFWFRTQEEAHAFVMAFADVTCLATAKRHEDFDWVKEEQILHNRY